MARMNLQTSEKLKQQVTISIVLAISVICRVNNVLSCLGSSVKISFNNTTNYKNQEWIPYLNMVK